MHSPDKICCLNHLKKTLTQNHFLGKSPTNLQSYHLAFCLLLYISSIYFLYKPTETERQKADK